MPFFGVWLPAEAKADDGESVPAEQKSAIVVESQPEALQLLKVAKGGRFRAFRSHDEAAAFSLAPESIPESAAVVSGDAVDQAKTPAPSEGCAFSSLTPQQMKQLKDAITKGDADCFDDMVRSNPRYLVTPSDTPSILHSGTRANALHVAAGAPAEHSLKMVKRVLDWLQDPSLIKSMYPTESPEAICTRQDYLLDLYLNMPNKGHNDTPLHIAAKFGRLDVVQFLLTFSSCNGQLINGERKTAAETACSRMQPGARDEEIKRTIQKLLEGQVYIPVIRDADLENPPYLGDPLPSHALRSYSSANSEGADRSPRLSMTPAPSAASAAVGSPRRLVNDSKDSLHSQLAVDALLGPFSPTEAASVKDEWKKATPRRLRLTNPEKSLEKSGRSLARKYSASMIEYWEFLNDYCDLASEVGLRLLDNHLETVRIGLEEKERKRALADLDQDIFDACPLSPVSELAQELDALTLASPVVNSSTEESFFDCEEVASSHESSFQTADEGESVYIHGADPTLTDAQVYEALRETEVDEGAFGNVARWKALVAAAEEDDRAKWRKFRKTAPVAALAAHKLDFDLNY